MVLYSSRGPKSKQSRIRSRWLPKDGRDYAKPMKFRGLQRKAKEPTSGKRTQLQKRLHSWQRICTGTHTADHNKNPSATERDSDEPMELIRSATAGGTRASKKARSRGEKDLRGKAGAPKSDRVLPFLAREREREP